MNDLRKALDDILILCNASRTYTRRTQTIHEIAMQGLGLTQNQRTERHIAIMQRTGGDAFVAHFKAREGKREANRLAKEVLDQAAGHHAETPP